VQFKELKQITRFKDIVAILVKYGFDEIVQRMELPGTDIIRKISPVAENRQPYERIRNWML
jgi:ubiquinone biosynthesis protein